MALPHGLDYPRNRKLTAPCPFIEWAWGWELFPAINFFKERQMPIPDELKPLQILRFKEVLAQTPFANRGKLNTEIRNGRFPRPIKLGRRAIGWLAEEVQDWVQNSSDQLRAVETLISEEQNERRS
jgi:prophage regulatory protein